MKLTFTIIFILLLGIANSLGQSIRLIRGDVDSSRSGFVTSTYNFRLIVKLDSVENCTGVSFVLWHNQSNYVIFSNFSGFDFSINGSTFVYPYSDYSRELEYLYIGLLSGDTIGGKGWDSPKVIELEFSVLPQAVNGQVLSFGFDTPEAIISTDSGGKVLSLKNETYNFVIHSFVEVWPGDANNDGKVSIDDVSRVGLYLGYGARKTNFRSYKRSSASTYWIAQQCLAWDSITVTYADCDGDGEVTLNDFLVIPLNFGKSKNQVNLHSEPESIILSNFEQTSGIDGIPLKVSASKEVLAIAEKIERNEYQNISIVSNKFLSNSFLFYADTNSDFVIFTIASLSENFKLNDQTVAYISGDFGQLTFPIAVNAISPDGETFVAYLVPDKTTNTLNYNLESILDGLSFPFKLKVYSLIGSEVLSATIISESEFYRNFDEFCSGQYLIYLFDGKKVKAIKLFKS